MWTSTALAATLTALYLLSGRERRASIPPEDAVRSAGTSRSGTQIAADLSMSGNDLARQQAQLEAFRAGERPTWVDHWVPVKWSATGKDGETHTVEAEVTPDYLAVGTDADPLTMVLGYPLALQLARARGHVLPTSLIVDKVWGRADKRYTPSPLPAAPGATMRKPPYWLAHRLSLKQQGWPGGKLLQAGHKKDVVVSRQLVGNPGRLAIYGWHKADGKPIQPVSLFHGKDYADYSHGVRLMKPLMRVDGQPRSFRDLLRDPNLWPLVSKEGPFNYDQVTSATALDGLPFRMV